MSRKNKPRPAYRPTPKKSSAPSKKVMRSQYEQCYIAAKKLLRHYELPTELVDVFTKRQKELLLKLCYEQPDVKAKKERTVPRQYVRNINNETYEYLKTNYWGDPKNNLTYLDLATYGFTFVGNMLDLYEKGTFFTPGTIQEEAAKRIVEKFDSENIQQMVFEEIFHNVWYATRCYSRVTYRMYGYEYEVVRKQLECGCCYKNKLVIRLTAQQSETKVFTYNNIKRKAYRLFITSAGLREPKIATVPRNIIFPRSKKEES